MLPYSPKSVYFSQLTEQPRECIFEGWACYRHPFKSRVPDAMRPNTAAQWERLLKGLMVSVRCYFGYLKGQLGAAGLRHV